MRFGADGIFPLKAGKEVAVNASLSWIFASPMLESYQQPWPPTATNLMIPDSSLGKAFFLSQTQNAGPTTVTLQSFNLTNFALLNSITISNLNGTVQTLVRWGSNGLAFSTNKGQIVILGGSFVN